MSIASTLPETSKITSTMAGMPDAALQQMAQMYKSDPYVLPLIVSESQRRQMLRTHAQAQSTPQEQPKVVDQAIAAMAPPPPMQQMAPQQPMPNAQQMEQQLPENQGIARLPAAQSMEFAAEGGIMGYAEGGGPDISKMSGAELLSLALQMEGVTDPTAVSFVRAIHAQESDGAAKATTSDKGARGPMQVTPIAFRDVADKDMDYNDTLDSVRAGVRYAVKGLYKAGGEPSYAAAFYYGGPQGLSKAMKGEAVTDPDNPDYPDTLEYGASIVQRMKAQGKDQAPVQDSLEARVSRIPGGPDTPPKPYEAPEYTLGQKIYGAGETGAALVTGAASPITGGIRSLGQALFEDKSDSVPKSAEEMTYNPRSQAGQQYVGAVAQAAEDLKLPPIMPGLAAIPRAPLGRSGIKALTKADDAGAKTALPRLATADTNLVAAQAAMKADTTAANRALGTAQRTLDNFADSNAGLAAANSTVRNVAPAISTMGTAAQQAGNALPQTSSGFSAQDRQDVANYADRTDAEAGAALPKIDDKTIIAAAKDTVKATDPDAKTKGLSGEDWLQFGLRLMATKSPHFLQAVGEAGVGALGDRAARGKAENEVESKKALSRYHSASADAIERGSKEKNLALEAEKLIQKQMSDWDSTAAGQIAGMNNPAARVRQADMIRRQVYASLGVPMQTGTINNGTPALADPLKIR